MSHRTKRQLIAENEELRRRLGLLEASPRDRAEEDPRREHHRAQQYLDVAGVIMVVLDNRGNIRLLNRKGHATLGYDNGDLLGRNWFETCVPQRIREGVKCVFEELVAGRVTPVEYYDNPVIARSGEERIVAWHNALLTDDAGAIVGTLSSGLDITERKQTEEALRESEERFRQAMEATNDGLWDWNVKSGDVYYSPAYSRILGYEAAEFASRTESWTDLLHPDDRAEAVRVNQACIENRIPSFQTEFRMRTKDGQWRTILGRGKAVCRDADGRAIRMIGTHVDITDRKRAEEALNKAHEELEEKVRQRTAELVAANDRLKKEVEVRRRAEEALRQSHDQLRAIYDEVVDGIIIVDAATRSPIRANSAYCRMLGCSAAEAHRLVPENIHPSEALPRVREHFEAVQQGVVARIADLPFVRKDGNIVYADVTSSPIRYNDRPCWISFFHDVTERKRAEEALRASEERFRSYFLQGLVGMSITGLDMRWQEVNDRLCEIVGYSREELLCRTWTELTHLDDVDEGLRLYNRMMAGEIDHYTQDKRYVRKDGEAVYTRVFVRCSRRTDGAVDYVLGLIEDITQRKRAQQALERERQTLWHMLQASDHERQLIAYEIHDGLTQQIAAGLMQFQAYEHLAKQPEKAKAAFAAGVEMLHLAYSEARRLISGVRPPVLDEAGLETAIAHLVHDRRIFKGPKIEYKSEVQFSRLPKILENALYRIAQEALTNACKHGQGEKVRVGLVQDGPKIRLEVQDWGIGFDPAAVDKGHFGLEGIRERVRLLGGQLVIDAAPGRGTLVRVEVPMLEREPARGD